jgi:hypothetical protein
MDTLILWGIDGFLTVTLVLAVMFGALRTSEQRSKFYEAHKAHTEALSDLSASPVLSLARAMSERDE